MQDYLQLWFDGPCINVTNPLTVQTAQASVTSWQPGFRDALCSQIAKIVAAVECRDGEAFIIRFEDGSQLTISLPSRITLHRRHFMRMDFEMMHGSLPNHA